MTDGCGDAGVPVFLSRLVARLVVCCDPDEILLFGSYAKGTADRASDADLLLVFGHQPSIALRNAAFDATRGVLETDLHLHERAELLAAAQDRHGFLGSVLRSGRSLYLRPGAAPVPCGWSDKASGAEGGTGVISAPR